MPRTSDGYEYGPHFNPRGDRSATDIILIHCSASYNHRRPKAPAIVSFHMRPEAERGRGWRSCGYHFLIEGDGTVVPTLVETAVGAHSRGLNRRALGICLIGGLGRDGRPEASYTAAQWESLRRIVTDAKQKWPHAEVMGHRDAIACGLTSDGPKACPCFDAIEWWAEAEQEEPDEDEAVTDPGALQFDRSFRLSAISVEIDRMEDGSMEVEVWPAPDAGPAPTQEDD